MPPRRERLRGLYAITPETADTRRLLTLVEAALDGGAGLVQYRDKSQPPARRLEQASAVASACRARGALFLVNDDFALARACGADGVHLGRDDLPAREARAAWPDAVVGVSCYADPARARAAARDGADYVGVGSMFASRTKPGAALASVEALRAVRETSGLPVAAIGGIDLANAPLLVNAQADMLAVISALFDAPDVAHAARSFAALYAPTPGTTHASTQP